MIDNLDSFNNPLKSIKKRVIKIEKKKLYSNKSDLAQIKNNKKKIRLITILYVLDLETNLLLIKRLCKIKLKKNFDKNVFYIRDNREQLILRIFVCNNVYVIDKVTKKLNKIIFIAIIIDNIENVLIVLSFTKIESNIEFTNSNNVMFSKFETNNFSFETINTFKLKEYRF